MYDKKIYWIKLEEKWVEDERIIRLANEIERGIWIYIKLQMISLRSGGKIEKTQDDFAKEIALKIKEDIENVEKTIEFLENNLLISFSENEIVILNEEWIGSETYNARYTRISRKRKKINTKQQVKKINEPEKKESKKEEKKEEKKNIKYNEIIKRIIAKWNELDEYGIQIIKAVSEGSIRKKQLKARISEYGEEDIKRAIDTIKNSDFLLGRVPGKDFFVTFDWFIKPSNFQKVLEGNYINRENKKFDFKNATEEEKNEYFEKNPNEEYKELARMYAEDKPLSYEEYERREREYEEYMMKKEEKINRELGLID